MHHRISRPEPSRSHVLVDKDRVTVCVHRDEAGRPRCALVRHLLQVHSLCLQLALQLADISEGGKLLSVAQILMKMRFRYNQKQRYQSIPQTTRLVTISAVS